MKTDLHSFDFPEDEDELLDSTYVEIFPPWEEDEFNRKLHQLSDDRYEEIKLSVVELFEYADVHAFPLDGFAIAERLGLKVVPYSSLSDAQKTYVFKISEDASLFPGFKTIFYNDRKISGRISMSLLHEIGHFWLKHTEHSILAEKEAGFFAKFAMAPPVVIHCLALNDSESLRHHFGLSLEASINVWHYYQKWANASELFTTQEMRTCRQFGVIPPKKVTIKARENAMNTT